MTIDLTSKRAQLVFLLCGIACAVLTGFGFIDFIQTQRTHEVFSAIGSANEGRKQAGETLESYEAFISKLRAIDTHGTKKELQPAFAAYVSGLAEGPALAKAGKNTDEVNVKIQAAHEQLVEIAKRYE